MSTIHTKKVLKKYFEKILSGEKTYEVRLADWRCAEGDVLELVEIDDETKQPTGRRVSKKVGTVARTNELDFWSAEDIEKYGYQIIGLLPEEKV